MKYWSSERGREQVPALLEVSYGHLSKALELFGANDHDDLSETYYQLGRYFRWIGGTDEAIAQYRKSLQLYERSENLFAAAHTRLEMARTPFEAGVRKEESREHAERARLFFAKRGNDGRPGVLAVDELLRHLS